MLSTLTGYGAVWSAGRGWKSSYIRWRKTTRRHRGEVAANIYCTVVLQGIHSCNTSKSILNLRSFSCLLKEQQSSSISRKSRLPAETHFPTSCHPSQTSTSSPWDSDLWPCHREADSQGPSVVTASTFRPDIRAIVALRSKRAALSQVTTELEQYNVIKHWWSD